MRRILLVTLVVVLSGATAALAARGDPQKRIVPADQARARAMLLKQSDLAPGFRATPPTGESNTYCKALDDSDLTLTGEAESGAFAAPGVFLSSLGQVYESVADSNTSWGRGTSTAGERCAREELGKQFRGQGLVVQSFRRVAFPRLAERSASYRLVVAGQGLRVFVDVVVLKQGRAQAAVLFGSALAPFPKDVEVRLARIVERRARTAMRGSL